VGFWPKDFAGKLGGEKRPLPPGAQAILWHKSLSASINPMPASAYGVAPRRDFDYAPPLSTRTRRVRLAVIVQNPQECFARATSQQRKALLRPSGDRPNYLRDVARREGRGGAGVSPQKFSATTPYTPRDGVKRSDPYACSASAFARGDRPAAGSALLHRPKARENLAASGNSPEAP